MCLLELGVKCLPPIDVVTCEMVPSPFDVVDVDNWDFIMQVAALGGISFIHFGTPCNTFSAARKEDGGPPPLRSALAPEGLETLSADNAALVFLGNLFLYRTVELALVVYRLGGNFSIENPLFSLMWEVPCYKDLVHCAHIFDIDFDQCMWGAPSMKPTRLACSHEMLSILRVRCDGCQFTHQAQRSGVECSIQTVGLSHQTRSGISVADVSSNGSLHCSDHGGQVFTFG